MRYFTIAVLTLLVSLMLGGSVLAQDPDTGVYHIDPTAIIRGENHSPDDAALPTDLPTTAAGPAGTGATDAPEPATIGSLVSLGMALALVGLYRRWRKRVMG